MIWSRRSLLMALLLALPVVFALALPGRRSRRSAAPESCRRATSTRVIVALYWIRNVLPARRALLRDLARRRRGRGQDAHLPPDPPADPRRRSSPGKFAAYLATTLSLALPAAVLTFFILLSARGFSGDRAAVADLLRDLGVMALALVAYGAFFALLGVLLKRPVIPGLLFLFGWELLANLPGYLPRFTLTAWLRSLIHHRPAQEGLAGLFQQVLPAGQALAVLVGVSAVFLAAAAWIFSTREYVLDQ